MVVALLPGMETFVFRTSDIIKVLSKEQKEKLRERIDEMDGLVDGWYRRMNRWKQQQQQEQQQMQETMRY